MRKGDFLSRVGEGREFVPQPRFHLFMPVLEDFISIVGCNIKIMHVGVWATMGLKEGYG